MQGNQNGGAQEQTVGGAQLQSVGGAQEQSVGGAQLQSVGGAQEQSFRAAQRCSSAEARLELGQAQESVQLQSQEQESVQLQSMLLAVFASCNFPRILPCCFFETSTKYLSFIPAPVARS